MKFELNPDQQEAMVAIEAFLTDPAQDAFILCGSAGTGKTTLVARIIELAQRLERDSVLVAPTGRAARILQGKLDKLLPAQCGRTTVSTLHGAIYFMANLTIDEAVADQHVLQMDFSIRKQGQPFDLMIVDEASMVGDNYTEPTAMRFGSGKLLSDLVHYVQQLYRDGLVARPIKLLFVGDLAQLPPVRSKQSPALDPEYLAWAFGLHTRRYELTTVMRQAEGSSILSYAGKVREQIMQPTSGDLVPPYNDSDLRQTDMRSAVDLIANNVRQQRSSAVVVYSNQAALNYNLEVRRQLWGDAWIPLQQDDRLLVTKNCPGMGLSNGDLVQVHGALGDTNEEHVALPNGRWVTLYFREVRLQVDQGLTDDSTIQCVLLENLLFSGNRDLGQDEQYALFHLVQKRNPDVDPQSDQFRELLLTDPYYNALQVKFGYALTCHKAQGGEWEQVVIDPLGVSLRQDLGRRWFYTAVTRASASLLLVA